MGNKVLRFMLISILQTSKKINKSLILFGQGISLSNAKTQSVRVGELLPPRRI